MPSDISVITQGFGDSWLGEAHGPGLAGMLPECRAWTAPLQCFDVRSPLTSFCFDAPQKKVLA